LGKPLCITPIIALELFEGAYRSLRAEEKVKEVLSFLSICDEVPFDTDIYHAFGYLSATLQACGSPVGDFDQAIAAAKRILELYPQSGAAYYWLGQCYEQQGKEQEALAAYRHASTGSELQGSPPQSLQEFWQRRSARQRASKLDACLQMQNSSHLGNRETTLDRLEWGFQHHCDGLQFLKAEPIYDNLRDDARYTKLISRLGL
jgi:tetratricopeptide (TPR) repeat protein